MLLCASDAPVALLAEGVDRNQQVNGKAGMLSCVALLAEGVDRNIDNLGSIFDSSVSPSSRRAWIEIIFAAF